MSNFRLILIFSASLYLGGCAAMSKDECLTADWQTVGYEHGLQGKSGTAIGQYRKACAKAGVTPDLAAYQAGRKQGLQQFCRPQNGFNFGERGEPYPNVCPANLDPEFLAAFDDGRAVFCRPQNGYNLGERGAAFPNVCPAHLEPEFLEAYDDGRTLHQLRADVVRLENQVAASRKEIDRLERDIAAATLQMLEDGLSKEDRFNILLDMKAMGSEREDQEDNLNRVVHELGATRQQLKDFQEQLYAGR